MITSKLSKTALNGFAPVAAIAMAAALTGCDGVNIQINGEDGVPLSELDMSGTAPSQIVMAGPDRLVIVDGDTLDIQTEGDGDAVDALRFSLEDNTLAVTRDGENWGSNSGQATITVTVPTPSELDSLGSGSITAQSLGGDASVNVLGSGDVEITEIGATGLDVSVLGSGRFSGSGSAEKLDLTVGGSGGFDSPGLEAENADIDVLGSGNARFASNGQVNASTMGSGNITVTGDATCTTESMGSGTVTCGPAS